MGTGVGAKFACREAVEEMCGSVLRSEADEEVHLSIFGEYRVRSGVMDEEGGGGPVVVGLG